MRRLLDRIYLISGWLSAATILGIALLISAQVLLNFGTRVLMLPLPPTIPSYADFAGFMLAAATFLAMPYTFRSGGHIRVSLITARLSPRPQLILEIVVLILAIAVVGFASWFFVSLILESLEFGDMSSGMIPVPIWIPQCFVGLGIILLLVALIDTLVETIQQGTPVIQNGEEV